MSSSNNKQVETVKQSRERHGTQGCVPCFTSGVPAEVLHGARGGV